MLFEILNNVLRPESIALIIAGLTLGQIVGCMPGLTTTMTLAVLVPFTFFMPISLALTIMGAIMIGSCRGGGIVAILVNIPGTPADIATTFDGYPLTKQGKAREALMMSIFGSVMGGMVAAIFLLTFSSPLANIALKFGPPELFWLCVLGIALMVALSEDLWKGMIAGFLGLLVTSIGVSPLGGGARFTFGFEELAGGVPIIVGLIGFYCIPRIFDMIQEYGNEQIGLKSSESLIISGNVHRIMWQTIKEWFSNFVGLASALIGSVIGIMPGAGGNIGGIMAYDQTKRFVKDNSKFGKGDIRGVIAAETGNNATYLTSLIPTLTFGVPGSPPAAIILGAILVQGIRPGADLFTNHAVDVYTFIASLFLANILLLPVGMYLSNWISRVVYVPKDILGATIAVVSVVGTLAIRGNIGDMYMMLILGFLMYFGEKLKFSPAPAVLGIVLGGIAEEGLTQSMMIAQAKSNLLYYFIGRPISLTLMIFTIFTLAFPFIQTYLKKRKSSNTQYDKTSNESASEQGIQYYKDGFYIPRIYFDKIFSILLVLFCFLVLWKIQSFNQYMAVFPKYVTYGVLVFTLCYLFRSWIPFFISKKAQSEYFEIYSHKLAFVIASIYTLIYIAILIPYLGFLISTVIYLLTLVIHSRYLHNILNHKVLIYMPCYSVLISVGLYYVFAVILNIHLPTYII